MNKFAFLSIFYVLCCLAPNALGQNWCDRLKKEGVDAWKSVSAKIGDGIAILHHNGNRIASSGKTYFSDDHYLSFGVVKNQNRTVVFGKNPSYKFRVQSKQTPTYTLVGLSNSSISESSQLDRILARSEAKFRNIHVSAGGTFSNVATFLSVISSASTNLVGDKVISTNPLRVEYQFTCQSKSSEKNQARFPDGGILVVEPENNWRIVAYEWQKFDGNETISFDAENSEFQKIADFELPGKIQYRLSINGVAEEASTKFFSYSIGFDQDECYLAYYGLPEPTHLESERKGVKLWVLVFFAGLVLVIATSAVKHFRQSQN